MGDSPQITIDISITVDRDKAKELGLDVEEIIAKVATDYDIKFYGEYGNRLGLE